MIRPFAIAVGDPAGVGPMVVAPALRESLERDAALVFGDARRLQPALREAGIPIASGDIPSPGEVALRDTGAVDEAVRRAFAPSAAGGAHQLATLDAAIAAVRRGEARGIVTGPTSKEAITLSGTPFTGQTERLAAAAGLADDDVTMMFLGPTLRVALATTHLAIADVPSAITSARVSRACRHLADVLRRLRPGAANRLHVCGLNPHAGEGGLFGDEDAKTIAPALRALEAEQPFANGDVQLVGPRPAEAVFREAANGRVDGVVAMFHDQATIASKLLDWGHAVNTTWGLPFVRTSVDHGVAYDAARAGDAHHDGMRAAIAMLRRLVPGEPA